MLMSPRILCERLAAARLGRAEFAGVDEADGLVENGLGSGRGCIGGQSPLGARRGGDAAQERSVCGDALRERKRRRRRFEHEHGVRSGPGPRRSTVDDLAGAHQLVDRAVGHRPDDAADDRLVETRRAVQLDRHAGFPEHADCGRCELVVRALRTLRIDVALVDQVVLMQVDADHRRIVGDLAQDEGRDRVGLGARGRAGARLQRILRGGQDVRRITDALAVDAFRVDGDIEVTPVARIAMRVEQRHQHHRAHGAELRNVIDRIGDGIWPGRFLAVNSREYPDRGSGSRRAQRDDRQRQGRARGADCTTSSAFQPRSTRPSQLR